MDQSHLDYAGFRMFALTEANKRWNDCEPEKIVKAAELFFKFLTEAPNVKVD